MTKSEIAKKLKKKFKEEEALLSFAAAQLHMVGNSESMSLNREVHYHAGIMQGIIEAVCILELREEF